MLELADILRRHGGDYLERHGARMPAGHRRAMAAILACRTPALGGHLYQCEECYHQHFGCHSCNHRACPKCGGAQAGEWLRKRLERLLPVEHFLVTFTVPAELRALCRSHQRICYRTLFQTSSQALQEVAADPRYLGAEPDFLGVLHTWTRKLEYHPHVHYVVPGGGLRPDGRKWRRHRRTRTGEPYFLPVRELSARFRDRFGEALRKTDAALHAQVPAGIWSRDWVVHCQAAGSGQAALGYLSAYVSRTALSNKRILSDEGGQVTFGYTESGTGTKKTLTLQALEFIALFLQHILPKGVHRVRCYGWWHPWAGRRLLRVETLLGAPLRLARTEPTLLATILRCPGCGRAALRIIASVARARPPPPASFFSHSHAAAS